MIITKRLSQLGIRKDEVYTTRINKYSNAQNKESKNKKELFNSGETHLITGGLGELGFSLAELMIEKGASHLVLMGRSKPKISTKIAIDKLVQKGATILTVQGDVSKPNDLKEILLKIKQKMPPLKGVFHTAGICECHLILKSTKQQFQEMFSPKVKGAYNLHNQTIHEDLSYFVLFSSSTSCFPVIKTNAYISVNSVLDGLTQYRESKNIPVTCINWGTVGAIMNSKIDNNREKWFEALGMDTMSLKEYKLVMENILNKNCSQIIAAKINVSKLVNTFPSFLEDSLMNNLIIPDNLKNNENKIRLDDIKEDQEKIIYIQKSIKQIISNILGFPILEISESDSLVRMGMDSISAQKMVNIIRKEMGVSILISEILTTKSVDSLKDHIYTIYQNNKDEENKSSPKLPVILKS